MRNIFKGLSHRWLKPPQCDTAPLGEAILPQTAYPTSTESSSREVGPLLTSLRSMPPNYGVVWQERPASLEWYTWMYNGRIEQHHALQRWFHFVNQLDPIQSALEFGCGLAVGYADFFKALRYVGTDLSEKLIVWCQTNRPNSRHDYLACDFITATFTEKFDLVFSQGTIDNTYDMDGLLRAAVAASRRWVYVTAYRGFFPHLTQHQYTWHEEHGCYYNDLSPVQAYQTLRDCGCRDIVVLPSYTGREGIPFETVIVARVVYV